MGFHRSIPRAGVLAAGTAGVRGVLPSLGERCSPGRTIGDNYATPDGTGVRDYIHVRDLARGHLRALERLSASPGVVTY